MPASRFSLSGGSLAVEYEPHVGNHAQHVLLVTVVKLHGLLVVGGEQDLGACAFAQDLLLFVEGVLQEFGVLQQDQFVEFGR